MPATNKSGRTLARSLHSRQKKILKMLTLFVFGLVALSAATRVSHAAAGGGVSAKPTTCEVCEAAASAAHVLALYEGWNATALASELGTVCGLIPQQYQAQCKLLVLTFGTVECQCIAAPSASFNATECCVDVAVCPSSLSSLVAGSKPAAALLPVPPQACAACKAVANLAHLGARFAGLNGTQLDAYLVSLCASVPVEYEAECQQVVQVGGLQISNCVADASGQQFSADVCCADIGLCHAPSQAHMNALGRRHRRQQQ